MGYTLFEKKFKKSFKKLDKHQKSDPKLKSYPTVTIRYFYHHVAFGYLISAT